MKVTSLAMVCLALGACARTPEPLAPDNALEQAIPTCPKGLKWNGLECEPPAAVENGPCPPGKWMRHGVGCVAEEEPEAPSLKWLVGTWATNCDTQENAYTLQLLGPDEIRQTYPYGTVYDFKVKQVGDVLEYHGTYNGQPALRKDRILDHRTVHYFYHFFEDKEWPADGRYVKCD